MMAGSLRNDLKTKPRNLCGGRTNWCGISCRRCCLVVAGVQRLELLLMIRATLAAICGNWIVYAVIAAAVAATLGYTYHLGHSSASAKWEAKYNAREVQIAEAHNAEVSRIAQANAMAKALEARRLADLEAANAALEKLIKEKSDEADADPDRDRPALSDSSRLRIDSIH